MEDKKMTKENGPVSSKLSGWEWVSNELPKITTSAAGTAIISASFGFWQSGQGFLHFYTGGLVGGIGSGIFFISRGAINNFTEYPDIVSNSAAGALTGTLAMIPGGLRRAPIGFVVGGIGGLIYKFGGDLLYDMSRDTWLRHRLYQIHYPRPPILPHMIPTPADERGLKAKYYPINKDTCMSVRRERVAARKAGLGSTI